MIPAEVSTASSLLEKPLSQLTEEDLGQITREECRRFLKERGMRRPSWNKSQAIQQVISLKSLLEDSTGRDNFSAAIRIHQKPLKLTSPPLFSLPPSSLPSPTEASGSGDSRSARTPAKDPSPYRRRDLISPGFIVGDTPRVLPAAFRPQLPSECHHPPPRTVADDPTAQLTIFYGGEVNVYEGVPSDKAREIFQIAATQDRFDASTVAAPAPIPSGLALHRFPPSIGGPVGRGPAADSTLHHHHLSAPAGKLQRSSKGSLDEGSALREPLPEGPTSRKASLKRYLEKRKDRYKWRRIIDGPEFLCLSQKLGVLPQKEYSIRSNSSSAMQPKPHCQPSNGSTCFERKKLGFFADLNGHGSGGN